MQRSLRSFIHMRLVYSRESAKFGTTAFTCTIRMCQVENHISYIYVTNHHKTDYKKAVRDSNNVQLSKMVTSIDYL
eukprot:snap_masked-scaffold_22-processed-gene-3.6-mRNA-1 protein AED:1.00 eAED:1.00 QI:0/-1/0/0/-1/1/1/0/75